MLLFDRFPGKARPKDECLATNNKTPPNLSSMLRNKA